MKKIIACLLLLVPFVSDAQDFTFKVLINKGKNEVKAGNNWQPIRTGSILRPGEEFKLGENAYMALMHNTGKQIEVRQSGSYKVNDLAANMKGGSSVLNKYTDFILSANVEKKNKLSATGAVHRGTGGLKIFLPTESAVVFGDEFVLDWEKKDGVKTYVVQLESLFGQELFKAETSDKTFTINLKDPKFNGEDNIMVDIYPKGETGRGDSDPSYMIKRISSADRARINKSYTEMVAQTQDNTAVNKFLLGAYFEENKLLVDAATAYYQAAKLAPDVQEYQDQYESFLLRNGMKEEKKETKKSTK